MMATTNNIIVYDLNQLIQTINILQTENASLSTKNNEQAQQIQVLDLMINQLNQNLNKMKSAKATGGRPANIQVAYDNMQNENITLQCKCDRLEAELKNANATMEQLKNNNEYLYGKYKGYQQQETEINKLKYGVIVGLQGKITKLENIIENYKKEKKSIHSRHRDYFHLGGKSQSSIQRTIRDMISNHIGEYLDSYNLAVKSLLIIHKSNVDTIYDLNISYTDDITITSNFCLYTKDKYHISDKCYTNLRRNLAPDLPSLNEVKGLRQRMNGDLINGINENRKGFYVNVRERIMAKIEQFLKQANDPDLRRIKIKISADSTNVGTNLKVLNVAFSIVNDLDNCKSEYGHSILGKTNKDSKLLDNFEVEHCQKT
jgi:hypothetical protein